MADFYDGGMTTDVLAPFEPWPSGPWLLVGAQSQIAMATEKYLRQQGADVLRTTRDGSDGSIRLALPDDVPELPFAPERGVAILFAAITGHAVCEADRDWTRRVNVTSMTHLCDALVTRGWHVVFLSSEAALPAIQDSTDGEILRSEYGFQKHLVEKHVSTMGDSGSVLRLSKVINGSKEPWSSWVNDLGRGKSVEAYVDYFLSPLATGHAAAAVVVVALARRGGVWQASGTESLSYFDFLTQLRGRLKLSGQVLPSNATVSRLRSETPTPMETSRLARTGQWSSPTTIEVCDSLLREFSAVRRVNV